ncbi:hypothetical protein Poli38472_010723 [Pythium oligandrum]|uniref:Peptidase M1 leukotriene A4 hydrolase/aminopeptidase C-terminal domain-containing protein n=1 Tax=Pythium oligandrum TaxID=41045 RepID=A0A8K1CED6_PYTOL|nr:hypothetical protein Poli38472_010723 [Pythium oligandrum]|eukprot:TMW61660.1 hypothetical protein Poli38472_010723 [Pythium oligandrum]
MCGPRPLTHHSYSNLNEVTFKHLHWSVELDFDAKELRGVAEYTVAYTAPDNSAPTVVLDTNHLAVKKVFVNGKEAKFELLEAHEAFGRALVVPIKPNSTKVKVEYTTTEESSGLQWLAKELTAGKTHPYLFTQCQAIHARSIVPCPDTPACKFTYSATVTVPEWCTCLMSAIATGLPAGEPAAAAGKRKVAFQQDVPIPSYLLAIAAGRLESMELGPRSRVWAEPTVVAKAAHEFAQTEEFLKYAEEITDQEYVWKRYDLVCLPPSFPYGGMENPCLTFVTPTLLAGDRSLADVVAHEISHSWTGNLVTNHTWKDFWLNEGWTMWLERKIMTKIYNDPLAYDLKATMGLRDLKESVEEFGADHPYTHLVPDSDNVDPDDVFSSIPYEKGFNFLNYLTEVVGGRDIFEDFAKSYIKNFRFKTLTSDEFKAFFINYFTTVVDKSTEIKQVDWDNWFYTPGMPLVMTKFDTTLTGAATGLGESMSKSSDASTWGPATSEDLTKWQTAQWVLLLDTLLLNQSENGVVFTPVHLDAIDAFANNTLTTSGNAELRFRWYTLSLRAKDPRQNDNIARFLGEQGRMKYVRPLFRDLVKFSSKAHAARILAQTKSMYHPICAKMLQRDVDEAKDTVVDAPASPKSASVATSLATLLHVPEAYVPAVAVAVGAVVIGAIVVLAKRR